MWEFGEVGYGNRLQLGVVTLFTIKIVLAIDMYVGHILRFVVNEPKISNSKYLKLPLKIKCSTRMLLCLFFFKMLVKITIKCTL